MQSAEFQALAPINEINLNKIAAHFGIEKKFCWEDPLILKESNLRGILHSHQDKSVFLFSFGSLVFINCGRHEITDILNYLGEIEPGLKASAPFTYSDDYRLEVAPDKEASVNFDVMTAPELKAYHREILATVLAKSTALERIEATGNLLLDKIESKIDSLEKGRLNMSTRQLAKISSHILRFKYNTISYLMLLDKPDIVWSDEESQSFFTQMSNLFELDERYELIGHKSDTLMGIAEVLSSMTQTERGNRLEWWIIILFVLEIALSLLDKIF